MAAEDSKELSTVATRKTSFPNTKVTTRENAFVMKVMRLPSPDLHVHSHVPWSPQGPSGLSDMSLTPMISMSSSMGTIYLGERFRACVSLTHKYSYPLNDVGVKIEMQTDVKRTTLLDSSGDRFTFGVDEVKDYILSHTVEEIGEHSLVCVVTYSSEEGQPLSFRKFFKLDVQHPFLLETALHIQDDILMACLDVTNNTLEPLYLEHVTMEPSPLFYATDLNRVAVPLDTNTPAVPAPRAVDAPEPEPQLLEEKARSSVLTTFGEEPVMEPQGARSYLFRVRCKVPDDQSAFTIGKFRIGWRCSLGRSGRIATEMLCRPSKDVDRREFTVRVVEAPSNVILEMPFTCILEITNRSTRPLTLSLELVRKRMVSVLPFGVSCQPLGTIEPRQSTRTEIQLVALGIGVQSITGISVSCAEFSNMAYNYDGIHNVLVHKSNESQE